MKPTICFFEDENYQNLLPLVYLRPVYELRCGILTLREKLQKLIGPANYILHCRNMLKDLLAENNPKIVVNEFAEEEILFVNGRLLAEKRIVKEIKKLSVNSLLKTNDQIIAARISKENLQQLFNPELEFLQFDKLELQGQEVIANLINYPWDLVNLNGNEIINDYELLVKPASAKSFKMVEMKNRKQIHIGKDSRIDPFVFLDASSGPIYIGEDIHIMTHSYIQGPTFIGDGSTIKSHTKIYHDTSIGEVCKIGGEVEASIIHSYSNKQHEGFLGHAYLGSWVNLGADTNNSDLKNNYGNVEVLLNGHNFNTGSRFVGLTMGDHSKTAINTMFNSGTIVGVSCNIFGAGFPPRYIPSFSWGGSDFLRSYDIEKSLDVAKIVMNRRNQNFSSYEAKLLRDVFEITKSERLKKN